jgi:hypothetical protein
MNLLRMLSKLASLNSLVKALSNDGIEVNNFMFCIRFRGLPVVKDSQSVKESVVKAATNTVIFNYTESVQGYWSGASYIGKFGIDIYCTYAIHIANHIYICVIAGELYYYQ